MKVAFVLCLLAMQGCNQVSHSNPALHDGRWGDYNNHVTEQCAIDAMVAGIDATQIEEMFNKCVFDQGVTI
ncbi:hypothetical protein D3C85_1455060 [compost metagenome]